MKRAVSARPKAASNLVGVLKRRSTTLAAPHWGTQQQRGDDHDGGIKGVWRPSYEPCVDVSLHYRPVDLSRRVASTQTAGRNADLVVQMTRQNEAFGPWFAMRSGRSFDWREPAIWKIISSVLIIFTAHHSFG